MKTTTKLLTGLLVSTMLAACGDSNATKDYPALKDKGVDPKTNSKPQNMTTFNERTERYFSLTVTGANAVNFMNFEQGKAAEYTLKVTINHPEIQGADLSLKKFDLADGPTLTPTSDPTVYKLQWKPGLDVVRRGDTSADFTAVFQIQAKSQNPKLASVAYEIPMQLSVKGNTAYPTIEGTSKLDKIQEGVPTEFIVTIDDPGTAVDKVARPSIFKGDYYYDNTEAYAADGVPYLFPVKAEQIGDSTKWKFTYSFIADRLPLDKDRLGHDIPSAGSVKICFFLIAQSVSGRLTDPTKICTTGYYSAQPPTISLPSEVTELKSGVETVITLKVATENKQAVVGLGIPSFTGKGKKEFSCNYDSADLKNSETCVIKLTPDCVKTETSADIKLSASSALNNASKSSTLTRTVKILPNAEACKTTGGH